MLAYVGTVLIFGLLIYLCAVMRDLRYRVTKGDKAWGVAWIGISQEGWSIAIFWASILFAVLTELLIIDRAANIALESKIYIVGATIVAFSLIVTAIFLSWSALQAAERNPPEPAPFIT